MKFRDEYRDPEAARRFAAAIARTATRPWTLMEVCGGQTHAIVRYGIDELLPPGITLVHGPGCPVCVTPVDYDRQGDRDRRPAGRDLLLLRRHAARAGHEWRPLARKVAGRRCPRRLFAARRARRSPRANPGRQVVFFAVGFETTAPANAMAVYQARARGARQFLDARLARPGAAGDATRSCRLADEPRPGLPRRRPCLHGHGLRGIRAARARNSTCRSSSPASSRSTSSRASTSASGSSRRAGPRSRTSTPARSAARATEPAQDDHARGVPRRSAPAGAASARSRTAALASPRPTATSTPRPASARSCRGEERQSECISGLVLCGERKPPECPAFGTRCTPEHPLGVTMVSSEGACAAYYRYRGVPRRGGRVGRMNDDGVRAHLSRSRPGDDTVQLAHGGGGRAMERLLDTMFRPAFRNPRLDRRHDGAAPRRRRRRSPSPPTPMSSGRCSSPAATSARSPSTARSTISPCAARGRSISAPASSSRRACRWTTLRRVVASMRDAARARPASRSSPATPRSSSAARPTGSSSTPPASGVSSSRRRSRRRASGRATPSSSAATSAATASPSWPPARGSASSRRSPATARRWPSRSLALLAAGIDVHCLRDLTRGGLASALVEIAETAGLAIDIDETAVPVREDVALGLRDPRPRPALRRQRGPLRRLRAADEVDRALAELRRFAVSETATVIGARRQSHDRPGYVQKRHRRPSGPRHARRRPAAADLLKRDAIRTLGGGRVRHRLRVVATNISRLITSHKSSQK